MGGSHVRTTKLKPRQLTVYSHLHC